MSSERVQPTDLPGTWEEISAHNNELAGQQTPLTMLPQQDAITSDTPSFRPASGRSLLRHAGTWEGSDLEDCLRTVYATRGQVKP